MVSGRTEHGSSSSRRAPSSMRMGVYERERKPHLLRSGVDSHSVRFEWIGSELACGLCKKTIQNAMVIRNCMHRFCADCILSKIHIGIQKCPLCNKVLPKKTPLKNDANFDAIISKFALTPERKCIKRPISETSNLCFAKKRLCFDKRTPVKRNGLPEPKSAPSSPDRSSCCKLKGRPSAKLDFGADSSEGGSGNTNVRLPAELCAKSRESLAFDGRLSCDSATASSFSLTASSSSSIERCSPTPRPQAISVNGNAPVEASSLKRSGTPVMLQRGSMMNLSSASGSLVLVGAGVNVDDETSKRYMTTGQCDASPIIVLQNAANAGKFNGVPVELPKAATSCSSPCNRVNANGEPSSKFAFVNSSLPPSSQNCSPLSNCHATEMQSPLAAQGSLPGSSTVGDSGQQESSSQEKTEAERPATLPMTSEERIAPPPEYLFLPQKQRILPGIDSELILCPEASVVLDKKLPLEARRPRFILTSHRATVAHLCEYLIQRVAVESGSTKMKKKRVQVCAVKADLQIEDVLVVSETGEGQFATLNVRTPTSDPKCSSVFTVSSPFVALDEQLTVETLRSDHWSNKKRPLKLIFKYVSAPQSK